MIEKLRTAVAARLAAGETLYRIAKDAGVEYASLHRFVNGKTITLATAGKLAEHLGLKLERQ